MWIMSSCPANSTAISVTFSDIQVWNNDKRKLTRNENESSCYNDITLRALSIPLKCQPEGHLVSWIIKEGNFEGNLFQWCRKLSTLLIYLFNEKISQEIFCTIKVDFFNIPLISLINPFSIHKTGNRLFSHKFIFFEFIFRITACCTNTLHGTREIRSWWYFKS